LQNKKYTKASKQMNMKKTFLLAMLPLLMQEARAADYQYLVIAASDGTEQALTASGLTITFSDGKLVATSSSATVATIALSDLASMYFSNTDTGIEDTAAPAAAQISVADGILSITAPEGTKIRITNTAGISLGYYIKAKQGTETIGNRLSQGIYLINVNSKSYKIFVK
jgi:hypothetical protein